MPEPKVELLLDLSSPKAERASESEKVRSPQQDLQDVVNPADVASSIEALMSEAEQAIKTKCVTPDQICTKTEEEDTKLLEDEVFDFDIPLSPDTSHEVASKEEPNKDEEEEVFFGPVGFTEKCVAAVVENEELVENPLSPLTASEMVEVFKQAQTVAYYIKKTAPKENGGSSDDQSHSPKSRTASNSGKTGKHERKGTFTMEIGAPPSDSQEENKAVQSSPLPPTLPSISLPKGEDGVIKFSATTSNEVKRTPKSASKSPKSGLIRRGTFRKSSGRPGIVPRIGGSKLPHIGPASDSTSLLKTSAGKNTTRNASPSKRQRTGLNESLDIMETASIASCDSDISSVSEVSSGKRKLRSSRSGSSLLQPGAWSHQRGNHQRSISNSSRSSATSSTSVASSCASVSSLPVGSSTSSLTRKPSQRKMMGPGYNSSLRKSDLPGSKPSSTGHAMNSSFQTQNHGEAPSSALKPKTKPELLRRGSFQRKTLAVNRAKFEGKGSSIPAGPLKATGPLKAPSASQSKPPGPMKAVPMSGITKPSAASSMKAPQVAPLKPLMPAKTLPALTPNSGIGMSKLVRQLNSSIVTPVKHERNVQPKRLLTAASTNSKTPPQNSSDNNTSILSGTPNSAKAPKRRSFLPTPNKSRTMSMGSGSQRSSQSSVGTIDSPASSIRVAQSPAIGVLVDLNGLDENSSPSCLKPKKSLVQHTPVNKENVPGPKRSIWSPVPRPKPISLEEAAIKCTKRKM